VLNGSERIIFLIFVALAILSAAYLAINLYIKNTELAPSYGGVYTEGIIGQPRFVNPIYGETNDIDRTLIGLVYSGIMTYSKDGEITNDLAGEYQISENGKTYTFQLKNNLFWQDGMPLTADDVLYTIKTIQNSDYKSPLRANWLDVSAEKISDTSFSFTLNSPYNSFLENCTVRIIPQHIWKNVPAEGFALSSYNLQPIGSGPYALTSLAQDSASSFIKNLTLEANRKYYGKLPYITKINFNFFADKDALIKAANQKSIDGFDITSLKGSQAEIEKQVRQGWTTNEKFNIYSFSLPRYFAVFFNQQNKLLSDINIAKGLAQSINKQEFIQKISEQFKEKINDVQSPILPEYFGYSAPTVTYAFDTEAAGKLFDKSGYKDNGSGQREKINDKKPAFQFKTYLSEGSKGNEVVELQGCLARLDESYKTLLQDESSGKYGKATLNAVTEFQKKYLPDVPSTGEVGTGTRKKLNELCFPSQTTSLPLQFTLTTINQSQLVAVANILKEYWQKTGVLVDIKAVELSELKDTIKNRNYDALLYGQAFGILPDLYPFWHSTQINDPGLNLSMYQNKTIDKLLKEARETSNQDSKTVAYEKMQDVILQNIPALFLYNPDYVYWSSAKVKGIDTTKIVDPSKRFINIQNWYIKTKRVFK